MNTIKFDELNLDPRILRAVADMGFEEASPIQSQAIPVELQGGDVIGQAQTGTGKTAAFGIPLLQKIDPENKKLQAVVLCPTRELAIQVSEEIRKLAKYMHGIKTLPIYGGQDIVRQIKGLKDGTQIIIGTPGRVMDHMRRKTVKFDQVHTVVLDEADEMMAMGFIEDMETILGSLPEERQTVMFSATMSDPIKKIAESFMRDPELVRVVKKELTVPKIAQYYYDVNPKTKVEVMCRLLDLYGLSRSVAFCNTKKQVDLLVEELQGRGYFAEGLHGDLVQAQRDRVMNSFRKGNTEILVATDVAARGIDVDDVEAVFNYDIPQDEEYYVHRIGRTGRAGREGVAFSFVVGREVYKLRDIQRYCKTKIIPQAIPSLDDITEIKADKILSQAKGVIENDDLSEMIHVVEKKLMEEEFTVMDLAAALLRMHMGEDAEDIIDDYREARSLDDLDTRRRNGRRDDRGGRDNRRRDGRDDRRRDDRDDRRRDNRRRDDEERPEGERRERRGGRRERNDIPMTRLFINVGKDHRVRPGDILGTVAGESGIPGRLIGSIDMYDEYSFVEVPDDCADEVLMSMHHVRIKGKHIHMERANNRR
jgi:ATP-dependent RNA helicase DeaD